MDGGIWSAGLAQALVHDVPSVQELVTRIIEQAEEVVSRRLEAMQRG